MSELPKGTKIIVSKDANPSTRGAIIQTIMATSAETIAGQKSSDKIDSLNYESQGLKEHYEKQYQENYEIVESFFNNIKNELTKKEYRYALRDLFTHLGAQEVNHPRMLKRHHVIGYKKRLEDKGFAAKTILKKISAVSSFCKFLAEAGMVEKDITYGITRPKAINKLETSDLKDKDVKKLFEALDPKKYNYHSYKALLAVGFYAGFRVKEICNLRLKNIGTVGGVKIFRTKVKGGDIHEITIHPFILSCLEGHLKKLSDLGFDTDNPDLVLFPSLKTKLNKPMSPEGVSYIFKSCLEQAGISKDDFRRYSPHTMRTTFASHLLNQERIPLQDVQRVMGHKNSSTTQMYNKRTLEHDKSPVLKISY